MIARRRAPEERKVGRYIVSIDEERRIAEERKFGRVIAS